jgi:YebC/PmpR family DNA-binding regulatory protein
MSGHSKWSTIKRKKGAADAKRGKVFSKVIREITVAARDGGGDPAGNPRLRQAMDIAKQHNMPSDNVDRAIKKGTGELEGQSYEAIALEGYGPGGAAVLIEGLTDNRNRSLAEIRHIFSKNNGSLGEPGSVAWIFEKKGVLRFNKDISDEETLMDLVLEVGAEDLKDEGETWEVITEVGQLHNVKEGLIAKSLTPSESELTAIPKNSVALKAKEAEQMLKLIDALEDQDDVQNVYCNMDISDEEMERISQMVS